MSRSTIKVSGEESLYIQTLTESIDLGEEVNVKGSEIELKASVTQTYERILSPFEQQVQEKGILRVAAERMMENQLARGSGELKALKNEAMELWDLAVDAADILINSDTVYEWVSGKEAAPLEERNDLMKGFLQAVDYGMETVTLQKSGGEIWSDITSAATSFVQPIVDMPTINPMMFNPAFILVPKSMTLNPKELLFQTKEESEEIGQKTMEGYIRIVDAGTMVLGAAGATKSLAKGVGKGAKNGHGDGGDGPEGKKEKDGEGKSLLTDQMDEAAAAASKDGKLKTNASTLEKLLDELEKEGILVEKLRNAVLDMLPFRVVVMQTADGSRFWQMMSQAEYRQMTRMDGGGGGKHGPEGTGKPKSETETKQKEREEYERKDREDREKEERERQDREREDREKEESDTERTGKIDLTEPTLPPGGKPKGKYEKPDPNEPNPITFQNEAADLLASKGYDIEMLPNTKGGNGYGIKSTSNPDFLINGKPFDCYSPETLKVRNIWATVVKKTEEQASRIVMNLDGYKGSLDELYEQFKKYEIPLALHKL